MHDRDEPLLDTEGRQSWIDWLAQFRRDIYPAFKKEGIPFNEAVLIVRVARLENLLSTMGQPHNDQRHDDDEEK